MIKHPLSADELLSLAQKEITDSASCFNAFLGAGVDDYGWTKEYHGLLVSAAHRLLECISDNSVLVTILQSLLERLHQALEVQDWLTRRMTLAVVAAYAETMPMVLRQADEGNLEQLLVRGTIDEGSYTSRRFALTALSYLRTVTADVVPALIAGCQDIEEMVQKDTIEAARRFQRIEGDLLSNLLPLLTGESVSTAYAVGQLLGALGTSHAGTAAGLQERIMTGLVEALKDPGSKRTVTIAGQDEGTLENALYDALLRVAGWIG